MTSAAGRLIAGLLILLSASALAREAEPAEEPSLSSATLTCDEMVYDAAGNVAEARGNAVLISSGVRMEADHLTLWVASQAAQARGRVLLDDGEVILLGDEMFFDWAASTGTLKDIFLQQGPWRMWARRAERLSPELYRMERAAFTTCDLDPPHYHFRAGKAVFRVKKRISLNNGRLALERDPVFWLPYYTRSLQDNRWTLTVDPGNSDRNGYFARTVLSLPAGEGARAAFKWDYYSNTGNGLGAEYTYNHPRTRGSVSGYTIYDRLVGDRRWNMRLGHWQQLSATWQAQSNLAFQSDEDVNNEFIGDDPQRVRQLGEADAAFTRTGSWYTARFFVEHDRAYDAPDSRFVTAKTILPQLGFQTSSLRLGRSSAYLTGGANFRNEYDRPEANPPDPDPILPGKDEFRQYADGNAALSWRLPLTRNVSLEPSAGLTETWQSHQDAGDTLDPADITQGRGFTGLNWRHRLPGDADYDLTHRYKVRWSPNTFSRDHSAADRGLEQNDLSFFASWRPVSSVWARANTAYDLRDETASLSFPSPRARFTPPSVEVSYRPRGPFSAFARETFQLYPARKPQSTTANFRIGSGDRAFFSSGINYNIGRPGDLDVSHGAAFDLTKGWWLSGDVKYTALGDHGIRYEKIEVKEKNLVVRRDLHCWVIRVTYRERPGVNELYLRLDLKTNIDARKSQDLGLEQQYYPARDSTPEF